ncbi:MAG: efflux transporter, family, subunit [Bryobacterales bacterium]|nr:efflux transporter, family, subunit [Bryobacterales bacterium]
MKRTSFLIASIVIGAIAQIGCSGKTETKVAAADKPVAIPVTTARAIEKMIASGFEQTGTFVADEASDVAPLVAGRVLKTPVDVGAWVKQGDVICELDHRDAQLRLDQARAQVNQANAAVRQAQTRIGLTQGDFAAEKVPEVAAALANLRSTEAQARLAAADATRYANLVATGDVSKSAADKARTSQETADALVNAARQQYEAALNTARQSFEAISSQQASSAGVNVQLAIAEKALADTTIRAPFDGFITARHVSAGEYVATTNKIVTIMRISTLKLEIQAPEQRASQAQVGNTVIARVAAYPGREFTGKIAAINPSVDPASRAFVLRAVFNNPDSALKPGMFASAFLRQPGETPAVYVPSAAVVRDKTTDSNQVFVIDEGKAHLRVAQIGEELNGQIQIIAGVKAGETVATSGQASLFEGAAVTVK